MVQKIGLLRKAEISGLLPLCGRPSYQYAYFLLMEYNNARPLRFLSSPAVAGCITHPALQVRSRMHHLFCSKVKESSVGYNLDGNES